MLLIKKVRNKLKTIPVAKKLLLQPYYFARTSGFIQTALNRSASKLYKKNNRGLSKLQNGLIENLQKDGIAFTSLSELFADKDLLNKLKAYSEDLLAKAQIGRKKTFLMYAWEGDPLLDLSDPLVKLALEPVVLEIAEKYLGTAPKFKFFSLNRTVPQINDEEARGSQRWHRDPGVSRVCKVFVYLSDVDDLGAGPFTYVPGSHSSGKYGKLFPSELSGREGIYPADGSVEKEIPANEIKPCFGKAGSVIFCDTLGLHKGGYSTSSPRTMITFLYEAPAAFGKAKFKYPRNFEEKISQLSESAQFALKP